LKLIEDIEVQDLKSTQKTEFIYSGNQEFYDSREQDRFFCNLLVEAARTCTKTPTTLSRYMVTVKQR
jgi:hypothetical protein